MADPTTVERLQPGDHVCWIFEDDHQRLAITAEQVGAGLAAGQRVVCYTDTSSPRDLVVMLGDLGVPVDAAVASGQLRVRSATDTYRAAGRPYAASMIDAWAREADLAREEGWPGVRVLAEMSWAVAGAVHPDQLAWYEAQVNRIFVDGYATAICLYDRRRCASWALKRITAAHPATAEGGASPDDGWRPLLRFRRTTDPAGLRLSGQADASNRDALTAVLSGLFDEVTGSSSDPARPAAGLIRGPGVRVPAWQRPVTVDVSELTFADGAAAHLLVRTADAAPGGLRLAGCSPGLARLIDLVSEHALPAGLVLEPA